MRHDSGNTVVLIDFNQATETTKRYVNSRINSGRNFYLVSFADNLSQKETHEKLQSFAEELDGEVTGLIVKDGLLEDGIESVVAEADATALVFTLNPDSKKGFFKSPRSLKLISSLNLVFVVLQHGSKIGPIKNIAMPLELSKESKQKFDPALVMASDLNAELKIFLPKFNDEDSQKAVSRNMLWTERYMKDKEVAFSFGKAEEKKHFEEQFIDYLSEVDADVAVVLNYGDTMFSGVFGGSSEYQILTNKYKVPVMIMNYRSTYRSKVPILGQ